MWRRCCSHSFSSSIRAPDWADRDRFVLSAGHGSMLIYALLHLTGYARPTMDGHPQFPPAGQPLRRAPGKP
jgi:transketolase